MNCKICNREIVDNELEICEDCKKVLSKFQCQNKSRKNINKRKFIILILVIIAILLMIVGGNILYDKLYYVEIPNLKKLSEEEAIIILHNSDLIPEIKYQYSDNVDEGKVIDTIPLTGNKVEKNTRVKVKVSKGTEKIVAKNSVINYYHINNLFPDNWQFSFPYIEDKYMYIDCIVKFGTTFSWNGDGFGIAAVNDTFDKTVPVIILYNNKEVEKNIEQNITLKIPISDLDVQKPTSIYLKLFAINSKNKDIEINLSFSTSW